MRTYGALNPIDQTPQPADSVQTMLLAAGTGQAMDWPGAPANAAAGGVQLVRFTAETTAGLATSIMVNLQSTQATVPTSGSSVTTGTTPGSTGNSYPIQGQGIFQIPGYSTGWSAAAQAAGYIIAEVWRK